MKKLALVTGIALVLPAVASAQTVGSIFGTIGNLINQLIPIVVALALLYFFYGLASYILAAGDEEGKAKGRSVMIGGIIALFIIVSIFGIIAVLGSTLGIDQNVDSGNVPGIVE